MVHFFENDLLCKKHSIVCKPFVCNKMLTEKSRSSLVFTPAPVFIP